MANSSPILLALGLLLLITFPVFISVVLYQAPDFNPVPLPADQYSFRPSISIPSHHDRALEVIDRIGDGFLLGPEDLAYDEKTGYLYTGCQDGWIRRVRVVGEAEAVEDWAYVGGRPLGVAFGPDGSLVVVDANKGLIMVKPDKTLYLLVDEAEGQKFLYPNGVDVASNSIVYFTDASYKYKLGMHALDILEGRPHGRLISFDPSTNQTVVLLRDLFFANGLTLSPDQCSLIFCETPLRRCSRYHIDGNKKGKIEKFVENLPGFPDNIRYDGEGHYWIALVAGRTTLWDMVLKHPFLRKLIVCLSKFVTIIPNQGGDSGVMSVNLEGQPISLYSGEKLYAVTAGLKIGKYLYLGSFAKNFIGRIALEEDGSDLIKSSK